MESQPKHSAVAGLNRSSLPAEPSRSETYCEKGASFVDRIRTTLVGESIRRRMPKGTALTVLDLGCGYHAGYLRALTSQVSSGVGVDFHVSEECKQISGLSFIEESIESALPALPDEKFDVVLFISVLEHVWDPVASLTDCYRVLRRNGTLLVNVPTWAAKPVLEFSAFRLGTSPACEMEDHKMYYGKRDLWPLLVRAGFRPSQIKLNYERFGMTLFGVAHK